MKKGNKVRQQKIDWDDFEEKIVNIYSKLIIPVALLWAITGCVASVLYFTS